jgi:hypothetical protein
MATSKGRSVLAFCDQTAQTPENEGTTTLRNVGKYLSVDTTNHPRRNAIFILWNTVKLFSKSCITAQHNENYAKMHVHIYTDLRTTCKWSDSRSGRFTSKEAGPMYKGVDWPPSHSGRYGVEFFCSNRDSNPGSPVQPVSTSLYQMCYLHTVHKLLFQSLTITIVSYMFNVRFGDGSTPTITPD